MDIVSNCPKWHTARHAGIARFFNRGIVMVKNVNTVDQVVRIMLGLVLISLVFIGPQTPWGWVGLILIATGFMNFCPVYRMLGISTIKQAPK